MGETFSRQYYNKLDYKTHQRLGLYKIPQQHASNIELINKVSNKLCYDKWRQRLNSVLKNNEHKQNLYFSVKSSFKQSETCGSAGIACLEVQPWINTMREQILARKKSYNYYTEQQVWYILYSLIKGCLFYEKENSKIGGIHTQNIIITQNGQIKLITKDSFPLERTNFQRIVQNSTADVFLAPQQLNSVMIQCGVYKMVQPWRSDLYSLGISILQITNLEYCHYLYLQNPLRISDEKMDKYFFSLKNRYSSYLFQTIFSLLKKDRAQRPSFSNLYARLSKFQTQINNFKPFVISQVATKDTQRQSHSLSYSQSISFKVSNASKK